jgi:CBS domain containing-hemolysin-like protein
MARILKFFNFCFSSLVWIAALTAVIVYMGFQWHAVVADCCQQSLFYWICALTVCIALCSLTETALSASHPDQISQWLTVKVRGPVARIAAGSARYALMNRPAANALVVLANTIATIVLTVITTKALIDPSDWQLSQFGVTMPLSGSYGFSTIGLTIILFFLGETIPKQVALKYHTAAILSAAWWISPVTWFFPTRLIALSIIKPIHLVFGVQD